MGGKYSEFLCIKCARCLVCERFAENFFLIHTKYRRKKSGRHIILNFCVKCARCRVCHNVLCLYALYLGGIFLFIKNKNRNMYYLDMILV